MTPNSILSKSITDLRALERYTIEVLELQLSEPELKTFAPAERLLGEIIQTLRQHIENLDRQISTIPGSRTSLQSAASLMAGAFLGFLTKTRSHDLMQILRDDCTLLYHLAMHCAILQTASTTLDEKAVFEIACAHKREIDTSISGLNELAAHYVRRQLGHVVRAEQRTAASDSAPLISDTAWSVCA